MENRQETQDLQISYVEGGGILEGILGRLLRLVTTHLGVAIPTGAVAAMVCSSPLILRRLN